MPTLEQGTRTPAEMSAQRGLRALLAPRSIAILGASADQKKLNGRVLRYLRQSGYTGRVYPINPKYGAISDLLCYATVLSLPGRCSRFDADSGARAH